MTDDTPRGHDRTDGSNGTTGDVGDAGKAIPIDRRRLLAGVGTAAAAGLAGCSGILGDDGSSDDSSDGSSDGGSGGGSDHVQNEVEDIEITGTSGEATQDTYEITVNLENTGGEDAAVLDFDYLVTLYDESGSEIEHGSVVAVNRDGFYNGNTGTVELQPRIDVDPSTVASYELRVLCDDGPYCE